MSDWYDGFSNWAGKHPVASGALIGGAAGSIVPGLGTFMGAVGGAIIGGIRGKDKKDYDKVTLEVGKPKRS